VHCAYLELMPPDLATVVRACVADGCDEIVVVPMFLGVGRHVRHDLPALVAELNQALDGVRIRLQPTVGEDARVVEVLARVALG
jgi:sirohydrochlorin cobaltochelatase